VIIYRMASEPSGVSGIPFPTTSAYPEPAGIVNRA
jgi:hypothetical protein